MFSAYFRIVNLSMRKFSSALYLTGDKAQKHFVVLSPVIDFDSQLEHKETLIQNVQIRELPIDVKSVEERWRFFKNVESRKAVLEQTRSEIGQNIAHLMRLPNDDNLTKEIDKLKTHLKIIKEDLKSLRTLSYGIEEQAALQVLNLPNSLHPQTPEKDEVELFRYLEKTDFKSENHLSIGREKEYFKFINNMCCYLKSDAALFEYAIQNYFNNELNNLKYIQFSNSDFVKSIIVEGCGLNPYKNSELLTLENIHCIHCDEVNRLHLVGASSLYSFMAYFARHFIQTTQFPIKSFCVGRKYQAVKENAPKSLFHLNQSSEISLFITSTNNSDILQTIMNEITMLYKQLGFHFRVVLVPANKLKKAESLKASIQMFSNNLLSYVEVGNISFYQSYLSKRLLLNYSEGNERRYPDVVGGSLINIHKMLGCVLENNSVGQKPLLSEFLSKYI